RIDELLRRAEEFLVNRWHALDVQRASVLDLAVGIRVYDAARSELLFELRILRIEIAFWLFLSVEVIEIAEELVEAMISRQMVVVIAEMVLAELAGRISLSFQDVGDRRHPIGNAMRVARHPDRQQAGPERLLT